MGYPQRSPRPSRVACAVAVRKARKRNTNSVSRRCILVARRLRPLPVPRSLPLTPSLPFPSQFKSVDKEMKNGGRRVTMSDGAEDATVMVPAEHAELVNSCGQGALFKINDANLQSLPTGQQVLIALQLERLAKGEAASAPAAQVATPVAVARPAEVAPAGMPAAKRAKVSPGGGSPGVASPLLTAETKGALMNKRISPINGINPYKPWTIRGRLTSKGDVRTIRGGPKRLFECELTDRDGINIRVTFWDELADQYYAALQEDRVYIMSGGNMKVKNAMYNSTKSDYEITANAMTKLVEDTAAAADTTFGQVKLDLVKLDKLPAHVGKKGTVDILFVVKEAYELGSVTRKSDSTQLSKRDFLVMDEGAKTVRLTVWGKLATENAIEAGDVCTLSRVRVGDWGGVSLSTLGGSKISVNPTSEEANALREWYEGTGRDASVESLGAGLEGASGGPRQDKEVPVGELEDLGNTPDKPDWVVCRGTICKIGNEGAREKGPYYTACPEPGMQQKVTDDGNGGWWCEKTQKTYDTCERRYIISVRVLDGTGSAWVQCYNDEAVAVIGCTADELHALKQEDPDAYIAKLNANQFTKTNMKLMVKHDSYNGEVRKRISCKRMATKLDWGAEARHLADAIAALKK